MPDVVSELSKNRILSGLPEQERAILLPVAELVPLHMGDVIENQGEPIQYLHFPIDSAISFTDMLDQEHIVEVTITSKEGCSGSTLLQGDNRSTCMAMVQIAGMAIRVPSSALQQHQPRIPFMKAALARYNLMIMRHAVISVGCGRFHEPPQRIARWLKAHWYRTGLKSFPFSDDFMGAQAGLDPKTVASVFSDMNRRGIIKRTHNSVTIIDHDALSQWCCECYASSKEATQEYLKALAEIARAHGGQTNPDGGEPLQ